MAGPLSGSGAMVLLHDPEEVVRMRDLAYAVSPGTFMKYSGTDHC